MNTKAVTKKAQQRLDFLRILRIGRLKQKLLVTFYRSTIVSKLMHCILAWYPGSLAADRKDLQRVINTAQRIVGCPLLSSEEISSSRCLKRTRSILKDSRHPAHQLFDLMISSRCFRSTTAWDSQTVTFPGLQEHSTNNNHVQYLHCAIFLISVFIYFICRSLFYYIAVCVSCFAVMFYLFLKH